MAWKGCGIYHVTLVVPSREPLLGQLEIPDEDPHKARVEATNLGKLVMWCFNQIPIRHPEISIIQLCLMPDHMHGILYVREKMPVGILSVVRGFWQGCKKIGREYTTSIKPNTIRQNRRDGGEVIFTEKPFLRVMSRKGQLQTMIRYIQLNPQRLATKRVMPGYFHVLHNVEIAGRTYDAIGNMGILLNDKRGVVHVHKEWVWKAEKGDDTELRDYMNSCVIAARRGTVMVSPAVSPYERAVLKEVIGEGYPIVYIENNGFKDFYKPADWLFDACAAGRVLILSIGEHDINKKQIKRAECMEMNKIAEEIAMEK